MAGARPRLFLLHGALGSHAQMARLAGVLESRVDTRTFDFVGHGERPLGGGLTMDRLVAQLAGAIEDDGAAPARLFGYSMGGYVALTLAATRPELVRSVATLGTKLEWSPTVGREVGAKFDAALIAEKLPKFAAALQLMHPATGWERLCGETRGMLAALGERPLLTRELLAGVAQPVRLMLGDRDDTVTLEETASAFGLLPAGQLEVLPATRHGIERVDVERLAASLLQFFA